MRKKRSKEFKSGVAALVAIAVLATGTFAWQSFNQAVTNETSGDPLNPGGRLHDDFDGSNKDIYVENFADELDGSDVFVRVKLDEYLEYGKGAGIVEELERAEVVDGLTILRGDRQTYSVITSEEVWNSETFEYETVETETFPTPIITDMGTWDTYLYGSKHEIGVEAIRTYQDMKFGNVINGNRGATDYMPTFNKNIDSLDSEVNGTLEGIDGDRYTKEDAYSDFILYNTTATDGGITTKNDQAEYSESVALPGESIINGVVYRNETHQTQSTLTGSVISIADWESMGQPLGTYWVYDTDGWAYWAQPLAPQTATALLLDGIKTELEPNADWYYSINVVAQIASKGDWGDKEILNEDGTIYQPASGMREDITDKGLALLNKVSGVLTYEPEGDDVEVEVTP